MTTPRDGAPATRAIAARARELTFTRFRFQVITGPDKGAEIESDGGEFSIGTAEGNQLVLHDPTVSRHHCVVLQTPQGALLRDLGSRNGTTLGGFRVESAYLKPGALVGVGENTLLFNPTDEIINVALAAEDRFGRLLGRSVPMRRIFAVLPRIASSESSILIEGETGTGKSLLAEAIHLGSSRAKGPFVVIDCGTIPPTLIETELFGHEKGAFTGAHAPRAGAFEAARGGTIFLDEIGELPLEMQPKLLRAIEDRVIKRVGSTETLRLDVRVIAATNRDLRQEVNRGMFRSDLYYRLNTVRLRIPPLRERPEDIPFLVAHFYEQFSREGSDPNPPAELVATLARQDWPGNVRELRSAVERAVLLEDVDLWQDLLRGDAPEGRGEAPQLPDFDPTLSFRMAKERAVARWERAYVEELVRRNDGNLSRAARAARMDRNHLRELLQKHRMPIRED
jgi:two-component system, NtrC family, response regulator GlrR